MELRGWATSLGLHLVGPEGLIPRTRVPELGWVGASCARGSPFWGEFPWLLCQDLELEFWGPELVAASCSLVAFEASEQLEIEVWPVVAPLGGLEILVER